MGAVVTPRVGDIEAAARFFRTKEFGDVPFRPNVRVVAGWDPELEDRLVEADRERSRAHAHAVAEGVVEASSLVVDCAKRGPIAPGLFVSLAKQVRELAKALEGVTR